MQAKLCRTSLLFLSFLYLAGCNGLSSQPAPLDSSIPTSTPAAIPTVTDFANSVYPNFVTPTEPNPPLSVTTSAPITPAASTTSQTTSSGSELLTRSFRATANLKAYHFVKDTTYGSGIMEKMEGDFDAPNKIRVTEYEKGVSAGVIILIGHQETLIFPDGTTHKEVGLRPTALDPMWFFTFDDPLNSGPEWISISTNPAPRLMGLEGINGQKADHLRFAFRWFDRDQQGDIWVDPQSYYTLRFDWTDVDKSSPLNAKAKALVSVIYSQFNIPVNPPIEP